MPQLRISLVIGFTTPPSIGAAGASDTLADKAVTRNAQGQFIVPASQVKGKLRHACEQLLRSQNKAIQLCQPPRPERMCPYDANVSAPCLLCQIFGSPQKRSGIQFHDLVVEDSDFPTETLRPMVSINRSRQTAEAQRLFLIETAPNIRDLRFESEEAITGLIKDRSFVHLLLAGTRLLFGWGGGTSRGLGWGVPEAHAWLDGQEMDLNIDEVKVLCRS